MNRPIQLTIQRHLHTKYKKKRKETHTHNNNYKLKIKLKICTGTNARNPFQWVFSASLPSLSFPLPSFAFIRPKVGPQIQVKDSRERC